MWRMHEPLLTRHLLQHPRSNIMYLPFVFAMWGTTAGKSRSTALPDGNKN